MDKTKKDQIINEFKLMKMIPVPLRFRLQF